MGIQWIFMENSWNKSTTAQDDGGNFRIGNLYESVVVANHGWQSESTAGLKGGWSCVFSSGYNGCSCHLVGHLAHLCWMQCGVVQLYSCSCSVVELQLRCSVRQLQLQLWWCNECSVMKFRLVQRSVAQSSLAKCKVAQLQLQLSLQLVSRRVMSCRVVQCSVLHFSVV